MFVLKQYLNGGHPVDMKTDPLFSFNDMSDYPVMHPNSLIYPDIRTFPIAAALLKDAVDRFTGNKRYNAVLLKFIHNF